MREIRIFGMRRSGNHAIIEWIASHFQKTLHYNECWGWENIQYRSEHIYGNKNNSSPNLIIYSYEDFCPSEEEIKDDRSIIILRDWYNMMSSRIITNRNTAKYRHEDGFNNIDILGVWLEYVERYKYHKNKTIIYNNWAINKNYRKIISNIFQFNSDYDRYTTELPSSKIGCGSSFEKDSITTNLINDRYKLLKDSHPNLYDKILNNQVVQPCKEIFDIEI